MELRDLRPRVFWQRALARAARAVAAAPGQRADRSLARREWREDGAAAGGREGRGAAGAGS
jgi:hypothetical protein